MHMQKIEPCKLPVWVKMVNIPLEACSMKGISALANSIGLPILMDNMIAPMCNNGMGNLGYARTLGEINAEKGLRKSIEIQYTDKDKCVKGTKTVQVVYDWTPQVCEHCKVFGHNFLMCSKRHKSAEELESEAKEKTKVGNDNQKNNGREEKAEMENQGKRGYIKNQYNQNSFYKYGAAQKDHSVPK